MLRLVCSMANRFVHLICVESRLLEPIVLEQPVSHHPSTFNEETVLLSFEGEQFRVMVHHVSGSAARGAVVWAPSAGGDPLGPAEGVFVRLARRLVPHGIVSLRVQYRHPGELDACTDDLLIAIDHLAGIGVTPIVLCGHGFGAAAAIAAGVLRAEVAGIAALSPQSYGTEGAGLISPRSLLILHGESDQILPVACAYDLYRRAQDPKRVVVYPATGHELFESRNELERDLSQWIIDLLSAEPSQRLASGESIRA